MHEKVKERLVTLPNSGTATWADAQCWPANLHMVIASNASHLAQESVRHLCAENPASTFTLGAKDTTWDDLIDATAPSSTDLAAATPVYRRVSWAPAWTLQYGPLPAICDRKSGEGLFVQRKIKVRIKYSTVGPTDSLIVCVLTTHDSPQGINEGDVLAFDSTTVTGSATGALDCVFDPLLQDRPTMPWYCREESARGSAYVSVVPLFLWVCVESKDGCTISSVSAWETR